MPGVKGLVVPAAANAECAWAAYGQTAASQPVSREAWVRARLSPVVSGHPGTAGALAASENKGDVSSGEGSCQPGPSDHGGWTALREEGYHRSLTAFCLAHSQGEGSEEGKVTSRKPVGSKEGEGGQAAADPAPGPGTGCGKEAVHRSRFTSEQQTGRPREAPGAGTPLGALPPIAGGHRPF